MKAKGIALKIFAALLLIGYGGWLLYLMFWGFGRAEHLSLNHDLRYNLKPLETIRLFARSASWHNIRAPLINLAGNVALFVPFGILFPFLFRGWRGYFRFIFRFLILIAALELLQGVSGVGVADVDDLILNGLGATLGYALYKLGGGNKRKAKSRASGRSPSARRREEAARKRRR
ncbi:VanZ family protein [Saccharibacillus sp. CPCC 101409]|uniref:VanZ family protein n=1 Tax=Saccharibacillus sp. CPCC 101409 TaxID=3058041 RepID=UPI0026735ECC|nr:VanZ family protein [Saccharibacillus sp. CPCC 101409]MDO3410857.1 VanZ family protein [Saccharibacillus sp. CPCC 101409]